MGDIADDLINGAFDRDEAFFRRVERGLGSIDFQRDPYYYHTKVYGEIIEVREKSILFNWTDRDDPVKVWIPKKLLKGAIKVNGQDSIWVWSKFWREKQKELNWSASVQEEHNRQKIAEATISSFIGKHDDLEELDCSNFVTKKKPFVSCRNSESADCSNMVSDRHKRKKARKSPPSTPEIDEFGGF